MGAAKLDIASNPLFDKQLINTFIESVMKTLSDMAQTKVLPGKPIVESKGSVKGEVAGIIGMVAGEVRGNLVIAFTSAGVFKILENMLGETHTSMTPEVTDAVGELTNMIYGSAKTTLNRLGYNFDMAIPTVVSGQFKVANVHNGITLSIPFEIEPQKFMYVEISVQT
jgi:chemotaxis protein CheX